MKNVILLILVALSTVACGSSDGPSIKSASVVVYEPRNDYSVTLDGEELIVDNLSLVNYNTTTDHAVLYDNVVCNLRIFLIKDSAPNTYTVMFSDLAVFNAPASCNPVEGTFRIVVTGNGLTDATITRL